MLFNWPSYYDSATGTKSIYEVDYKQIAEKCGLSFPKKIPISLPEIKSSSPPTFHSEFQMTLDSLLKLLKDELSKKERPWVLYPKVAKVIDNILEYVKIEGYYLRAAPAEGPNVHASPSFCFIIQRLVRLTKDLHLLCKYCKDKGQPELNDIRRILRDLIRAMRERCERFTQIYYNGGFEFGDHATSSEVREMLIAQFLQLVKLLWNFTKYNDHKIFVEKSSSGMSFYDGKTHDIWSLMDSSVKQVENGGSSVSPVLQKRELVKKLNFPQNGSMNTVSDLASLNDVLVRRKGSNNDESQPSARISYNGSINELSGLSRGTSSTRPSMVNIERRRTADNNDRPVGISKDIKSSHEAGGGGLKRSNSIQEKKVTGITGRETGGLEDVSELDSSIENGSPKRARNYLDREIRKTRDLWEMVGETKSTGVGGASLAKVDSLELPSKVMVEEEDGVKVERNQRSMTQILFMKAGGDDQSEIDAEDKPAKRVTDKRLKLITMAAEPESTVSPPRILNLEEGGEQVEQNQQEEEEAVPRRLNFQRGKTMFENTEFEEGESPWISPSPSPVKGRFIFKPEEIQEVNEDDSPTAHRKKSGIQSRNNGFVRRIKRRNSTSIIARSSRSPRRTTELFKAEKEKETMLRERRREKQGYCYQKKFQNERRQDFLTKIFGDKKQTIQKHFEDAHGLDINRTEKENKKPLVRQDTEEFHHCPVKNMSRLADVPVTISESWNFFNKLRVEKHEEAKGQTKRKQRLELWKRGRDAMKARHFLESLQEEEDGLSPTVNRNHKRQTLDICSQGINNTLKSFRYKNTTFVGPLRKTKECNKILEPARGYFIGEQKENLEVTEDLEISLMLARFAFKKRLHRSPDDRSCLDDSRDNSGSGFSFKKRRGLFRSLFSQSPSGGDTNNNSPRSDRSRSDSRDYGPAPASATKPSLFKSLFSLNPLDISVLSPKTRGRSNSIESVKDSGSSASPNARNQSSLSAHKRPSLFKSLFKLNIFDKDGEKSSASEPKTADLLDPETPSPSEFDSPTLRKSRSEHKRVGRRFY